MNPEMLDCVVDAGAVDYFCMLLKVEDSPDCQVAAARILSDLAKSHRARDVVGSQAVLHMFDLMGNENIELRVFIFRCFQNLAEKETDYRNALLNHKGLVDGL